MSQRLSLWTSIAKPNRVATVGLTVILGAAPGGMASAAEAWSDFDHVEVLKMKSSNRVTVPTNEALPTSERVLIINLRGRGTRAIGLDEGSSLATIVQTNLSVDEEVNFEFGSQAVVALVDPDKALSDIALKEIAFLIVDVGDTRGAITYVQSLQSDDPFLRLFAPGVPDLLKSRKIQAAIQLQSENLSTLERTTPNSLREIARVSIGLGLIYELNDRLNSSANAAEIENLYLSAVGILEKIAKARDSDLLDAYHALTDFYNRTRRFKDRDLINEKWMSYLLSGSVGTQ